MQQAFVDRAKNDRAERVAVQLSAVLIAELTNAETHLFNAPSTISAEHNRSAFAPGLTSYPEAVLHEVYRFFVAHGLTDWPTLRELVAQWLCMHIMDKEIITIGMGTDGNSITQQVDICRTSSSYWLGRRQYEYTPVLKNALCMLLAPGIFSFDRSTILLTYIHPLRLYKNETAKQEDASLVQLHDRVTFNLDAGAGGVGSCTSNCAGFKIFNRNGKVRHKKVQIVIQGKYQGYDDGKTCAKDAYPGDCRAKARIDELKLACGCRSTYWSESEKSRELPYCATLFMGSGSREYAKCARKLLERNETFSKRVDACSKPNCNQTVVAFVKDEFFNIMHTMNAEDTSVFGFYALNFAYPYVQESLKVKLEDLFSNLGGNLSLWLGGSFIALLHLIIFPIRNWLCGGGAEARQQAASLAWNKTLNDLNGADIVPRRRRMKEQLDNAVASYLKQNLRTQIEAAIEESRNGTTENGNAT